MEGWVDLGTAVSVQPMPKAAYCSDFRENTNFCPQCDSNLGFLAQQASVLPLNHCDITTHSVIIVVTEFATWRVKSSWWPSISTHCNRSFVDSSRSVGEAYSERHPSIDKCYPDTCPTALHPLALVPSAFPARHKFFKLSFLITWQEIPPASLTSFSSTLFQTQKHHHSPAYIWQYVWALRYPTILHVLLTGKKTHLHASVIPWCWPPIEIRLCIWGTGQRWATARLQHNNTTNQCSCTFCPTQFKAFRGPFLQEFKDKSTLLIHNLSTCHRIKVISSSIDNFSSTSIGLSTGSQAKFQTFQSFLLIFKKNSMTLWTRLKLIGSA